MFPETGKLKMIPFEMYQNNTVMWLPNFFISKLPTSFFEKWRKKTFLAAGGQHPPF